MGVQVKLCDPLTTHCIPECCRSRLPAIRCSTNVPTFTFILFDALHFLQRIALCIVVHPSFQSLSVIHFLFYYYISQNQVKQINDVINE